jgi:hypothetical protein
MVKLAWAGPLRPVHSKAGLSAVARRAIASRCPPLAPGAGPVRRLAGGDQAHPFQAEGLAGRFGQAQVAVVDGVEGAAEEARGRASGSVIGPDVLEHVEGVGVEAGEDHGMKTTGKARAGSRPSSGETSSSTPIRSRHPAR